MAQVTWTLQSLDDLTAIAEYHEASSLNYAILAVRSSRVPLGDIGA